MEGMNAEQRLEHIRALARARAKKHHALHKDVINAKHSAYAKANRAKINAGVNARKAKERAEAEVMNPTPPPKKKLRIKGFSYEKLDDLIGDKIPNEETKNGHLRAIKSVMRLTVPELAWALEDADKLISAIDNGQMVEGGDYSLGSKIKMYQAVLKIGTILEIPMDEKKIDDAYQITKMKLDDETTNKPQTEYPSFETYLEQVATRFGVDSREFLIASMYNEFTCRDDLGLVISDTPLDEVNYLLVKDKKMSIVLNQYKQHEQYGQIKHRCSSALRKLTQKYIAKKNLKVGDLLFGVPKLTDIVELTNKRLGYTSGINLYRHMKITDTLKEASYEDRLALSKLMGHSPATQLKYLK